LTQSTEKTPETFADLLTLIQQGNGNAETELVNLFEKGLYYAMRHRTGDNFLAEDICQETWRILLEKIRRLGSDLLENPKLLPAYIHHTALNLFLAEEKKTVRRRTDVDHEALVDVIDENCEAAVDELARTRMQKRVREVIDSLQNARDRLILYRYYIQEQSKEQICRELSLDSRHFDRVAHRARDRLRLAVEQHATDLKSELELRSDSRSG
jgi:RNA polymerase sigma-70 factor (ECF subfamily)